MIYKIMEIPCNNLNIPIYIMNEVFKTEDLLKPSSTDIHII